VAVFVVYALGIALPILAFTQLQLSALSETAASPGVRGGAVEGLRMCSPLDSTFGKEFVSKHYATAAQPTVGCMVRDDTTRLEEIIGELSEQPTIGDS